MTTPAFTFYPLTNTGCNDANKQNRHLRDIIAWLTDGTFDLTVSSLTVGGVSLPSGLAAYIRKDGTVALTADWDAGAFEIRALAFESDVATGTAPFTIASRTLVPNLNVELLNGNASTYFAPATAISGTQNYLAKFATASTVANSSIFDNGTLAGTTLKFGVGTISPSYRFNVLENSTSVAAQITQAGDGYGLIINSAGTSSSRYAIVVRNYAQTGADYFRVMTQTGKEGDTYVNGSLGVGITPGTYKLDVNGTAHITGDTRIDGNLGIGMVPVYDFDVTGSARISNELYVRYFGMGRSGTDADSFGYNVAYTSSAGVYNYATADVASIMRFDGGGVWLRGTATTGVAGNPVTFNDMLRCYPTGVILTYGRMASTTSATYGGPYGTTAYFMFANSNTGGTLGGQGAVNDFTLIDRNALDILGYDYTNKLLKYHSGTGTTGAILNLGTRETAIDAGDVLGLINFYAPLESSGTDAILPGASIAAIAEASFTASVNSTSLIFYTGASETATEKMRLTSAGYLGIGTIPERPLDVNGTTDQLQLTYNSADGSATYYTRFATDSAGYLTISPSGGETAIVGRWVALGGIPISVSYSGTSYPSIGYNFIGTATGGVWNYVAADVSWAINFGNSNSMRFQYAASGTAGNAITYNTFLTITNAGEIGVGITAPAGNLHIYDNQATADLILDSYDNNYDSIIHFRRSNITTDTARISVQQNDGTAQRNSIKFATGLSDTTKIIFDQNGYIGIGTTTPLANVHVGTGSDAFIQAISPAAHTYITGSGHSMLTIRDATNDIECGFFTYSNTGKVYLGSWTNHTLVIRTNNVDAITIDTQGNSTCAGYLKQAGIFGGIHVHDASTGQAIPTGTTYTKLTCYTDNNEAANVTPDAANDKITITIAGRYQVSGSFNFYDDTNNVVWRIAPFLNGTEQDHIHVKRKIGTATDSGSASFTGVIDVTSVPVDLDVRARHDYGGDVSLVMEYSNFNILYVGET